MWLFIILELALPLFALPVIWISNIKCWWNSVLIALFYRLPSNRADFLHRSGQLLRRSRRCSRATWETNWSPKMRSCVTSVTWRLWPIFTRAWNGLLPASRHSSLTCPKRQVSPSLRLNHRGFGRTARKHSQACNDAHLRWSGDCKHSLKFSKTAY